MVVPAPPRFAKGGCYECDQEEASSLEDATNIAHSDAAIEGHTDCVYMLWG